MTTLALIPPPEHVHWWFATGFLMLGLCLLARAIVGVDVWERRRWRRYLWPSLFFALGIALWPVTVFFTDSTMHTVAHAVWAQAVMLAGAAGLGLAAGKLHHPAWALTMPLAFAVSGAAFLVHEQNGWLFSRSAFVHHACGWVLIGGAVIALAPDAPAAVDGAGDGVRADVRRARGDPLRRPRRRARLRPPVA